MIKVIVSKPIVFVLQVYSISTDYPGCVYCDWWLEADTVTSLHYVVPSLQVSCVGAFVRRHRLCTCISRIGLAWAELGWPLTDRWAELALEFAGGAAVCLLSITGLISSLNEEYRIGGQCRGEEGGGRGGVWVGGETTYR